MGAMNDFAPSLLDCHVAQIDNPDISQASCFHQLCKSSWVTDMAFVQSVSPAVGGPTVDNVGYADLWVQVEMLLVA